MCIRDSGQTHGQLGLLLHETVIAGLLQAAGIAGVSAVILLLKLLACLLYTSDVYKRQEG